MYPSFIPIILFAIGLCVNALTAIAVDSVYGHSTPTCALPSSSTTTVSLSQHLKSSPNNSPVIIPCGIHVVVDPGQSFTLPSGLVVDGVLSFSESPDGATIKITTPYILVRGHFLIGSSSKPYSSKLHITLTDSGSHLTIPNTSGNPAFGETISAGRKVIAVYGGSIRIFGSNTAASVPFTKLIKTAKEGAKKLFVAGNLKNVWNKGDTIAISRHTAYVMDDEDPGNDGSSMLTIKKVKYSKKKQMSVITLSTKLSRTHLVRKSKLTDGSGRSVAMAPSVARLTRNIVISGMPLETDMDEWLNTGNIEPIGGHIIVTHSAEAQVVRGVELVAMGQAGINGRYPLHAHFLSDVHKDSVFEANSIHHSKQRCIVVHATNNLNVVANVAFRTAGHCYLTEDGIEKGNTFRENIGISIRSAIERIATSGPDVQSDDDPAVFWFSSPRVNVIQNVAAGSDSFGFWYESFDNPRGQSRDVKLPGYDSIEMFKLPFGTVEGNEAHSAQVAFATYPEPNIPPVLAELKDLFLWSSEIGWQVNEGGNQILRGAVMVDIREQGIHSNRIINITVEDTVISSQTSPLGDEEGIEDDPSAAVCEEESGDEVILGILMETRFEVRDSVSGLGPITLRNVHFQNFNAESTCRKGVGILINVAEPKSLLPPSSVFDGVSMDGVDQAVSLRYLTETYQQVAFKLQNSPAIAPGVAYAISKGFNGEDILAEGCTSTLPSDPTVYVCANQCWRHVILAYDDEELGGNTKVRFTDYRSRSFDEPRASEDGVEIDEAEYSTVVSKMLPAGKYDVEIVKANGDIATPSEIDAADVLLIKTDETNSLAACTEDITISMNGVEVKQVYPVQQLFNRI